MATDHDVADLQAQIVALRLAVEGTWLSLLSQAADPLADAQRLGRENAEAVGFAVPRDDAARAMQKAVVAHTEQLWNSIAWQLGEQARKR